MRPEVFQGSDTYRAPRPGPVLTIGNFDGVHLGHQHLLRRVVERARALDVPACVYTFDPPPRAVLEPSRCPPRILSLPDRIELLGEVGVDQVVIEPFDRTFAARSASWFAEEILGNRLSPSALVVGHDFRFGRGREGHTTDLARLLPDMEVDEVDVLVVDGVRPSSSRIRESVAEGRVEDAALMLGRPFSLRGAVVQGDRRGRELGFPTANLETRGELLPAGGVYAVRADFERGGQRERWPGVANLGVRPTFAGRRFMVEVHLIGFSGDLYGRELRVSFLSFLRPEARFPNAEALTQQIRADLDRARAILIP